MKKISFILAVLLIFPALLLNSCSVSRDDGKITVLCSVFPIYDIAANVIGDSDSVETVLLCEASSDMHSYQPSVSDIVKIKKCDIFVYIGGQSDSLIKEVVASLPESVVCIDLFDVLKDRLIETVNDHHAEHDHGENCIYDEHIWLSLKNCTKVASAISSAISSVDTENEDIYTENAQNYISLLEQLDLQFESVTQNHSGKTLLFADRFPFAYLLNDYSLNHISAFPGCSAEYDTSFATVISLAQKINDLNLSHIFITESGDNALASSIISASGKEDVSILSLESMQSFGIAEIKEGVTYIDVMKNNLEVLKKAFE